jgi:hypothetical protein
MCTTPHHLRAILEPEIAAKLSRPQAELEAELWPSALCAWLEPVIASLPPHICEACRQRAVTIAVLALYGVPCVRGCRRLELGAFDTWLESASAAFWNESSGLRNVVERILRAVLVAVPSAAPVAFGSYSRWFIERARPAIHRIGHILGITFSEAEIARDAGAAALVFRSPLGALSLWTQELGDRLKVDSWKSVSKKSLLEWDGREPIEEYCARETGILDILSYHFKDARYRCLLQLVAETEFYVGRVVLCGNCGPGVVLGCSPCCTVCDQPSTAGDAEYWLLRRGHWRPSWAYRCSCERCREVGRANGSNANGKVGVVYPGISGDGTCVFGTDPPQISRRVTNIWVRARPGELFFP